MNGVTTLGTIASPVAGWLVLTLAAVAFLLWLFYRGQVPRGTAPTQSPTISADEEDDLKVIEGIGPKLEQVLKAAGIKTYRDLAAKSVEELQAVLDAAGIARISNPETWPEQAQLAAAGQWEALRQLQDTLKGGRRVA